MTTRNDILQRLLNLRALAESSSSENEAMNAMKVADSLMRSYDISEAELALAEGMGAIKVEIVDETKFGIGLNVGRVRHKVQSVIWSLESYCEVEVVLKTRYVSWRGNENGIHIIGDRPDVELFWYLLDVIRDAMDREYASWVRKQQGVGRGAKAAFQLAMGRRISQRLAEMKAERAAERKTAESEAAKLLNVDVSEVRYAVNNGNIEMLRSSMALVVASVAEQKRQAVSEAYAKAYKNVRLGTASGFGYSRNQSAAGAGAAAGNRVGLGRPVGKSTTARLN